MSTWLPPGYPLCPDVLARTTTADPPVIMRSEDGRRLERTRDGFRLRGAD